MTCPDAVFVEHKPLALAETSVVLYPGFDHFEWLSFEVSGGPNLRTMVRLTPILNHHVAESA